MLKINTRSFGDIEIADEKVIDFSQGLPGFPDLRRFTLINNPDDEESVFFWLQSLEDGDIAFCLIDLSGLLPNYDPMVDMTDNNGFSSVNHESFFIYNVVVIPDNPREMTVNLKAPILINPETMQGVQVICMNEEYSIRHRLLND